MSTTRSAAIDRRAVKGGAAVALAIVGLVAGGLAAAWLAGVLAGVLGSGRPVVVGLGESAAIVIDLPATLTSDPARAWPSAARDELPGRTGMLAAVLGALALVVGATMTAVKAVGFMRGGGARGAPGPSGQSAQWAQARDLRGLRVNAPRPGRVVLGRHERHLIAAEPRVSVMVVAPSQSGKTTGLAIPAILEWDGPVLATSVKGDLVHDTLAARRGRGEVRLFDPTGSTGLASTSWSPIAASAVWEDARRTAARLLQVGEQGGSSPDEAFWRPTAARYLAPLLMAAQLEQASMGEVLSWIATGEQDRPQAALQATTRPGADAALDALTSVWGADERFRSSVTQTAATALDAWQEPRVAAATREEGSIDPAWLLDGENTLYLIAPAHDQRRLRGLFAALISAVVTEAFDRSTATGGPIDPPLLLCLDEAANVAPLPNLDEIASTGPGQGVQLLSVFQNMSQVADRWGHERAETIVANHRARLFGSGIADRTTLEYLGAVLGDEEIERISTTKQRDELMDLGSKTTSRDRQRIASPHRVRQSAQDSALLVYGRLPPAWIALRPWYRDRTLTRQVQASEPVHRTASTKRMST